MSEEKSLSATAEKEVAGRAEELTAKIQSIETGGAVDGPGIRYIVFFQGCQFKCLYCHNRDTWDFKAGEEKVIGFLVGQVMKEAHGKANPSAVQEILRKKLK